MKRVGDLKLVKTPVKDLKPTPANERFALAAEEIRLGGPDAVERAYIARQLVQCTLPHANPGNVPVWSRKNGNLTLSIVPAIDRKTGKSYGYPYGSIPRLLLFWMVTTALQQRDRCIAENRNPRRLELGHNLAEFMREVGLDPNTGRGKRSDAKRLREQMQRLFGAIISFDVTMQEGSREGEGWLDMQVAPEGVLWWDPKNRDQFFSMLTQSGHG